MLICPNCSSELPNAHLPACGSCQWQAEEIGGIPSFFSDQDRSDPVFAAYFQNYDTIAGDDLSKSIMDERYVGCLAQGLADMAGDVKGAQVCDVGVGKGYLSQKLLDRGAASITAVDISTPYLSCLKDKERISLVHANAENLPFRERFDIIASTDVLEHVLDLGSVLYSLNRALKPGGTLYIRVPYFESLLGYSRHFGCPYRFVHLRTFTKTLLRRTLEPAGFHVERFSYFGYWPERVRPIWTATPLGRLAYRPVDAFLRRQFPDVIALNEGAPNYLRWFIEPIEIAVAARKVATLAPNPSGGYILR